MKRRTFLKMGLGAVGYWALGGRGQQAQETTRVIFSGDEDEPWIAITYDDLWYEDHTLKLGEIFADAGLRVTFFPVGLSIRANIDRPTKGHEHLYPRLYEMGHEFGCHTFTHRDITDFSARYLIHYEIYPWIEVLEEALGFDYVPVAFRPPFGIVTNALYDACIATDLPIVLWGTDMRDSFCQADCDAILMRRFEQRLASGEIFLQHTIEASVSIAEAQIEMAQERGFELVPLSQMLDAMRDDGDSPADDTDTDDSEGDDSDDAS